MKFYTDEKDAVLHEVASTERGLAAAEAEKRLEANGKNKLKAAKKDSLIKRFFKQLADPMILILLGRRRYQRCDSRSTQGESFTDVYHHPVCRHRQRRAGRLSGEQGGKGHRGPSGDDVRRPLRCCATAKIVHDQQRGSCRRRRGAARGGRRRSGRRPIYSKAPASRSKKRRSPARACRSTSSSTSSTCADGAGRCPARRPHEYGLHGHLPWSTAAAQCCRDRHRHGHRDGQDRRRSCAAPRRGRRPCR